MRKGIILEINDLYLTLLTPEGEFLRARKLQQDYHVGEEIHFFPEMAVVKRKRINLSFLNNFKARTIALSAALMLVMTAFIPVYQNGQVYAYMSIDVNPSIELAVNDELKVLEMSGYNSDGKEIIAELHDWKDKDATIVAEMILEKIGDKGFFKENHDVVIATVHTGKVKEDVDQKLDMKISEIKKSTQEEDLEVKVMEATTEDREKAKKQGLTTGIYKEKQVGKQKPVDKPAEQKKESNHTPAKKDNTPSVNPKPEKKEAPGQVKKTDQITPKANQAQQNTPALEKNRAQENKSNSDAGQNKHGRNKNHGNGSDKNGQAGGGKKYAHNKPANSNKRSNNDNKANKQPQHKHEQKGNERKDKGKR